MPNPDGTLTTKEQKIVLIYQEAGLYEIAAKAERNIRFPTPESTWLEDIAETPLYSIRVENIAFTRNTFSCFGKGCPD